MSITNSFSQIKEITHLKQVLKANPKDTEALLQFAVLLGMLKEPDLDGKRKMLKTILNIEPSHQKAREMLLEMDRAEMGGSHTQSMSGMSAAIPNQIPSTQLDKPRVFRYSILLQLIVYLLVAFTLLLCFSAIQAGDWDVLLVFVLFLFFLIIPLWFVSAVVEVHSLGLKLTRLFGITRREMSWSEIDNFKSNVLGQGIRLFSKDGRVLEISAQMSSYSAIIELLRQMRPDLFSITRLSPIDSSISMPISDTKTFQKSFLVKYGPLLLLMVGVLVLVATIFTVQCIPALFIAIILFFLWRFALYTPYLVKMEENRLSTQSFLKKKELTPQQIKDIRIISTQTRRGFRRNHLQINLLDGDLIYLSGFPEGIEIMYGFLKNWWATYQNA